jgi:hypothetical protein
MTRTTFIAPNPLQHILDNLRPVDREEIEAVRGEGFDSVRVALQLCQLATTLGGWIFWHWNTGEPVAVLGAYAMTPKVAGCWAFGTPGWDDVVTSVTRQARRVMVPQLLKAGFHRAECRALAKREDTRIWLTSLGWKAEAVLSEFGIRHEDFTLFAWLANEQTDHPRQS